MTIGEKVLGVFAAVLLVAVTVVSLMLYRAQGRERVVGLQADSLAAALDTSRRVVLSPVDSTRILGDSIGAVIRRSFQERQRGDALDRALGLERSANAELRATILGMEIVAGAMNPVEVEAGDVRRATFAVDSTPYHATVDVRLPPAGRGSIDLRVRLDPARLAVRLDCGAIANGIRSASAVVTGPPWVSLSLDRVSQDPEVCNPATPRRSFLRRALAKCGVGPGASLALVSGRLAARPSVNADCHVWP